MEGFLEEVVFKLAFEHQEALRAEETAQKLDLGLK